MQKHLSWYPWVCALLILGILVCTGLMAYMLTHMPRLDFYPGAQLVKEVFTHAHI